MLNTKKVLALEISIVSQQLNCLPTTSRNNVTLASIHTGIHTQKVNGKQQFFVTISCIFFFNFTCNNFVHEFNFIRAAQPHTAIHVYWCGQDVHASAAQICNASPAKHNRTDAARANHFNFAHICTFAALKVNRKSRVVK